jgi:hypothetical protein
MKSVKTYECPTDDGIIITDLEGHEFECVDDEPLDILLVDHILQKYGLEIHLDTISHKKSYVAIKPLVRRTTKMGLIKIVLTALSSKVEQYINKIIRLVEQNK